MPDTEVLELFREEAREHLAALETALRELEASDQPSALRGVVDSAFRRALNMKGTARTVGLDELQNLGQQLEDTLDLLREEPESATRDTVAQAIAELDALKAAYENWEDGGEITEIASEPLETEPADVDWELLTFFREESQEHVEALEILLLDLENTDDAGQRRDIIDNVFRHAHSVKGAARAIGMDALQALAQKLEDTLDAMREQPDQVGKESIDTALAQFDAFQAAYNRWEEHTPDSSASLPSAAHKTGTPPPPSSIARAGKASEDRLVVRVPAERLDRMLSLAGEVRVSQRGSDSLESQLSVISELFAGMLASCKRCEEKQPRGEPASSSKTWLQDQRVQLESAVERLRQLDSDFGKKRFREELLVEALEQDIRTARLVPLANLTDSMRRAVRDLVQSLDKSINYQPDVGDILLDKAVMESLKDPLMHLIRNAADHGIESPADRRAAGKPEEATIAISAARRAESVLIRVHDDGGGIDFHRVRQKLMAAGGLEADDVRALSEKELARYLFQAGFTTKQQATELSGRGVGMDVVLEAIHRLQGTVELEDSSPSGTTFLITVPVTISTARILTVNSSGQRYGVPTTSMVRTGRLRPASLREIEGNRIMTVDGKPVRWVELSDLLGSPSRAVAAEGDWQPYLLLAHEGRQLALAVDEFEDESEVILKSLEFPLTELDEVIGGTIRPDGSVQLVLDPAWLIARALRVGRRLAAMQTQASARLLVVDDSPTTRSMLRNVLSAAGYAVQTAVDGADAVERLRSRPFDLVVSDVEMPRMNGLELTRQVKSRFNLPVILVTGLEKEEDRRQGLQAGADAYVVKSTFEDKGLLEIIKQFV